MKTELMTQVTASIFEVMETMFFLTLEPLGPEDAGSFTSKQLRTAAITFSGKFSGTIYLEIPLDLLEAMTRDFMGQDLGAVPAEHSDGTLKEALNMVAGNALTRVDETDYMGLGLPEIVASPAPGQIDSSVVLDSGQGCMAAHIRLNQG